MPAQFLLLVFLSCKSASCLPVNNVGQHRNETSNVESLVNAYLGKDPVKSKDAGEQLIKKGRAVIPVLLAKAARQNVKIDKKFLNSVKWEAEKYKDNLDVIKKLQKNKITLILDDSEYDVQYVLHKLSVLATN